jgi:hypothetical protein
MLLPRAVGFSMDFVVITLSVFVMHVMFTVGLMLRTQLINPVLPNYRITKETAYVSTDRSES